jgi:hypothetical protein
MGDGGTDGERRGLRERGCGLCNMSEIMQCRCKSDIKLNHARNCYAVSQSLNDGNEVCA